MQVNQAKVIPMLQVKSSEGINSEEKPRDCLLTEELKARFSEVGIKLNKTLIEMIESSTEQQVMNALGVVEERLAVGQVKSKTGLFRSALVAGWEPNEIEADRQKSQFDEWYELARAYGIVIGKKEEGDVILVQENTKVWIPYEKLSQRWTLDYLRRVVTGK